MSNNNVKAYFEEVEHYKATEKPGTAQKLEFLRENATNGDRLLDIGCGSGFFLDTALAETPISGGVGLDVARNMLPDGDERGGYVQGTVSDVPFCPDSFDFVHVDTTLHHVIGDSWVDSKAVAEAVVDNVHSLVASGGAVLVTELFYESRLGPDWLLSYTIFNALKYGARVVQPFHKKVSGTTPPIRFFTRPWLRSLLEETGAAEVRFEDVEVRRGPLAQRLLTSKVTRTNIFVEY